MAHWVSDFDATHTTGTGDVDVDFSQHATPLNGGNIHGVAWHAGRWVAVGRSDFVIGVGHARTTITSDDEGATWHLATGPFDGSSGAVPGGTGYAVAWGGGVWVQGGQTDDGPASTLATSPDGSAWTLRSSPFDGGGVVQGLAYGSGVWLALGSRPDGSVTVARSVDNGATWAAVVTPFDGSGGYASAAQWASSRWVAVGAGPGGVTTATSDDGGVTWSAVVSPLDGFDAFDLGWDRTHNLLLASGHGGSAVLAASTDRGATWSARSVPAAFATRPFRIQWDDEWVAVGAGAWRSADAADAAAWSNIVTSTLSFQALGAHPRHRAGGWSIGHFPMRAA